ncbi:MAG TPA: M28 family peptidase, partial [Candidatus Saccharimonadales bacterium]|nr:M28 family peptidase [Candidatus Saccharimonadales bacterium]
AAFNLEEWGMVGSQHHADALHAAGREIEGMISLEMIGYVDPAGGRQRYPPGLGIGRRSRADFISVVGNRPSRRLAGQVAAALREVEDLPVESVTLPGAAALLIGASLSDHSSFWRRGAPAVMVGDTAFYRNPHYHDASDRMETLSMPFLGKVTRGLAVFLDRVLRGAP